MLSVPVVAVAETLRPEYAPDTVPARVGSELAVMATVPAVLLVTVTVPKKAGQLSAAVVSLLAKPMLPAASIRKL